VGAGVLSKVDNVIIRNLDFQDAADCFPQWDPTDSAAGNWNSEYDTLSLVGATHVWVDHCSFSDGANPDSAQPVYFGRPYQVHDGLLDVTTGSDLVTLSWNVFRDHDKAMLIGSTNNPKDDLGKLRVTVHHNVFRDILQRAPRVRFGQVHVYNNLYAIPRRDGYEYTWGVGVQSQIYAENNFFSTGRGVTPDQIVHDWGGTRLTARGSLLNGVGPRHRIDLVGAYNATHDPDLGSDAGWSPVLHTRIDPAAVVPVATRMWAGAGRIG
jgi:pectate lyase